MNHTRLTLAALFVTATLLIGSAAQACQLVCVLVNGLGATDASCAAVKPGFKKALPGMASSLSEPSFDFYGADGGMTCQDAYERTLMMSGDAGAAFQSQTDCASLSSATPKSVCCNM